MKQAAPQARHEKINDPVTLISNVNGAKVTVQRNSIAHAELAKGENGMLVKVHNPHNRTRGVSPGVAFKDGVIVREPMVVQGGSQVTTIAPAAQAMIRQRDESALHAGVADMLDDNTSTAGTQEFASEAEAAKDLELTNANARIAELEASIAATAAVKVKSVAETAAERAAAKRASRKAVAA